MPRSRLKLDGFLPYRLSLASNAASAVIAQAYSSLFKLKTPEWRVIAVIAEDGELTQQGLVRRTQMDKVTVSRAAQVLERRRLVRRVKHAQDGRALTLSLTPAGTSLYRQVVPRAVQLEREVFSGISAKEISVLTDILQRVERAAAAVLDRG